MNKKEIYTVHIYKVDINEQTKNVLNDRPYPNINLVGSSAIYAFSSEEGANDYVSKVTGIDSIKLMEYNYAEWIRYSTDDCIWFIYFELPVELDPENPSFDEEGRLF